MLKKLFMILIVILTILTIIGCRTKKNKTVNDNKEIIQIEKSKNFLIQKDENKNNINDYFIVGDIIEGDLSKFYDDYNSKNKNKVLMEFRLEVYDNDGVSKWVTYDNKLRKTIEKLYPKYFQNNSMSLIISKFSNKLSSGKIKIELYLAELDNFKNKVDDNFLPNIGNEVNNYLLKRYLSPKEAIDFWNLLDNKEIPKVFVNKYFKEDYLKNEESLKKFMKTTGNANDNNNSIFVYFNDDKLNNGKYAGIRFDFSEAEIGYGLKQKILNK